MKLPAWLRFSLCGLPVLLWGAALRAQGPAAVEFNKHIRPILSDNCFACHGPDEAARKADLRLDTEAGALGKGGGPKVIVPGKPDESELVLRVLGKGDGQRMPPAKFGKQLSAGQIELLRRWV